MTTTFFYARRYSVDSTQEYVVGIDTNVDPPVEYSLPDPIEDLEVDNFKINKALYDAFATTGLVGQVLLTDSTKVFWGDVSGIGTPLQTIGVYDESIFQGVFSNFNFIDGTEPDNLVRAKPSTTVTGQAEVYISDRWSPSVSMGVTNIYRNSRVGIGSTLPEYELDVFGKVRVKESVNIESNLNVLGITTLQNRLNVVGSSSLNNTLNVVGLTTLQNQLNVLGPASLSNTLQVTGITTLQNQLNVLGPSSLSNTLYVNDVATLQNRLIVNGPTLLNNNLNVIGVTTLQNQLNVLGPSSLSNTLNVAGVTTLKDRLNVVGPTLLDSGLNVVGVATLQNQLFVTGKATLQNQLDVIGDTALKSTLQVGTSGTVINTNNLGAVGFGTNNPQRDIHFYNKDVFFDRSAIYDANNDVGFRTEKYQVPRNVLTTVGVDTTGNIISGRFYDAANLIRLNLDYIANETIGFLTSTDYKNPAFTIVNSSGIATDIVNCKDDIKNILKAITYDITRGGNSRSVGAGLSYYNGNTLIHINTNDPNGYSVKDATIVAITTAAQIARYVINNLPAPKSYQGIGSIPLIRDFTLQDDPIVGFNTDPDGCSNVVSAITVCAGIVTTIIGSGPSAAPNINNPDGKVVWAPAGADSRNIIYVSKYGNDDNNGRTEGAAKLTIGAAAAIAQPGDTIMIKSGVYAENNPIGLRTDVTVSGQDLRLVTIYPQNDDDVFYVRRGCLVENLSFAYSKDPYDEAAPIVITGAAVAFPPPAGIGGARSGYLDPGPATEGPTGRWRSPYIRNCTNFMTNSIGMKINGDHATASTIGNDLKCMVCDSFTQYNENGIGVSITNNGYAQLVSIFTINCNIGIYCDSGGSCDLTNSNSSFGNFGLVAVGLGSTEFTGRVGTYPPTRTQPGADAATDTVGFTSVFDSSFNPRRPYDGQAIFFKIDLKNYSDTVTTGLSTTILQQPMVQVQSVQVLNGGSGFSAVNPPTVIIRDSSDLSQNPKGPQGIIAEVSPTIDPISGTITAIDVVNSGRNYLPTQNLEVFIDGGDIVGAAATVITQPIYYTVDTATQTSNIGVTTVTFNEFIPYELFGNEEVYFKRISRILTSSHSFEYIGTGTNINTATPFQGAVPIKENEVVALDGAQIPFTSTDQKGNFDIGEGFQINQPTATIRGRDFSKAIQAEVTPLILALR